MSTNWKDIGMNSGNMKHHRNITSNRVNYENGKWDSIYDISGIDSKGYIFDISGQNVVVGIGTDKPFSRLSLGSNENSGEFSPTKPGQLAAIALNEESNGDKFNGLFYNTDISGQSRGADQISGIQLMSSVNGFNVTDSNNGQLIIGSDNVTTVGGRPRIGNESYTNATQFLPGTHGDRKIVLDARGSIRTDGYINFYNKTSTSYEPPGASYDNHDDIPVGSLFLSAGLGDATPNAGLYFKKTNNGNDDDIIEITGGSGGGGGSGIDVSGSAFFDGSLNHLIEDPTTGIYHNYPYIIQKNEDDDFSGGTPITFSGGVWSKEDASGVIGFQNALTIRQGNLSVVTENGENIKVTDTASSLLTSFQDYSGGIIFAEKQLLIGTTTDTKNGNNRSGYAIIDTQTIDETATLLSYNFKHSSATSAEKYNPAKASNSIILLKKDINEDGNTANSSKGCVIGNIFDASNSIIIGGRFGEVSTPNSLISHPIDQGYCNNNIVDPSGCNIVFGYKNTLQYTPNSFIMGAINNVDNTNNKINIQTEGGTIVVGSSNKINNKSSNDPINKNPQNVIFGNNNNINNSENSFIQGKSNINFGSSNVIFGNSNKLGNVSMTSELNDYNRYYTTENSFVQGKDNQILAPSGETILNAFIAGKNNTLDMSSNTFSTNTNSGFTLLGCYAGISGENFSSPIKSATDGDIIEDLSNIRFALGTKEMYDYRTGDDKEINRGNVFTIDYSGNTHIYGNLIVDGSNVVLRTEYLDVSDNNLSLNYPGTNSPEGGGITILDTTTGQGHKGLIWTANHTYTDNCWDTSGADISTNNIFAMDISAQDISCVDISAASGYFQGDVYIGNKLTVVGLIDPTGLIISSTNGVDLGTMGATEAGLYTDGDDLFFVPKSTAYNSTTVKKFAQVDNGNILEVGTSIVAGTDGAADSVKIATSNNGEIIFEGSADDDHQTSIQVTNPTADRTITFPNATGNVVLDTDTVTLTNKTLTTPTISTPTISAVNATTGGQIKFREGTDGGTDEVTLECPDTVDSGGITVTLPSSTGTIALTSDITSGGQSGSFTSLVVGTGDGEAHSIKINGSSGGGEIIFEGTTKDSYETKLVVSEPTADQTITFPNATGNVVLDTNTVTLTNKTLTTPTISTPTISTPTISAVSASTGGQIKLREGTNNGSNVLTLQCPADCGTGITVTLPSSAGTIALTGDIPDTSNFITASSNDTLTNKTLTTPTISTPTISAVGTSTGGQIKLREGTNNGSNVLTLQCPADCGTGITVTLPSSAGTIALTGDIPDTSNFITASSNDTLTNKTLTTPIISAVGTSTGGQIKLREGNLNGGTNIITLQAPGSINNDYIVNLPTAAGNLITNADVYDGTQGSGQTLGAPGLVPGRSAGALTTTKFLREDGSWQIPSSTVDWANPGTIGSNNANSGAFTTLSASSTSTLTGNVTVGGDTAFSITKALHSTGGGTPLSINGQEAHDDNQSGVGTQYKGGDVSIVGGAGANSGEQGDININGENIKFNNGYGNTGTTITSLGIQTNGSLTVDSTSTLTGNVSIGGNLTVGGVSLSFTSLTSNTTISSGNYVIGAANLDITLGTPSAAGQIVTIYTTTNAYDLIRNSSSASVAASSTTVCISTGTGAANWIAYRNGLGIVFQ